MTDKKRRVAERLGWINRPRGLGDVTIEEHYWLDPSKKRVRPESFLDDPMCVTHIYNTPALFCDAIEQWLENMEAHTSMHHGRAYSHERSANGFQSASMRHRFVFFDMEFFNKTGDWVTGFGQTKEAAMIEAVCQMLDKEGE